MDELTKKPEIKKSIQSWRENNIFKKLGHCCDGLRTAFQESSLRHVTNLMIIEEIVVFIVAPSVWAKAISMSIMALPFGFELVNSALECAVNFTGVQYSTLARDAKDMAAAASMFVHVVVFLSFLLMLISALREDNFLIYISDTFQK